MHRRRPDRDGSWRRLPDTRKEATLVSSHGFALHGSGPVSDHRDRFLYSPIVDRPVVRWPGGARVAVWVAPNVEHYEYTPPPSGGFSIFSRVPPPDVQQFALRDYGNRVGFWRLADLLGELGIRPTVSLNLGVLDHYPEIAAATAERGWAIMSHGIYNTRSVDHYDEETERAFIADNVGSFARHTGGPLRGMLGPALSVTARTCDLMAEAGMTYSADWPLDDQPVPIRVRAGRLVSVPYSYELNDGAQGPGTLEALASGFVRQFDRLWREGEVSGRVMCIALHPFVIGTPHGIGTLRTVLEHIAGHDGVWWATADEIADHYLAHHYDEHVAHVLALAATQESR